MSGQIAFTSIALHDGVITAEGSKVAPPPDGDQVVMRVVLFKQGDCYAYGAADAGQKSWSARVNAPDFVEAAVVATGIETHLVMDEGDPVFTTITWIQHVTIPYTAPPTP